MYETESFFFPEMCGAREKNKRERKASSELIIRKDWKTWVCLSCPLWTTHYHVLIYFESLMERGWGVNAKQLKGEAFHYWIFFFGSIISMYFVPNTRVWINVWTSYGSTLSLVLWGFEFSYLSLCDLENDYACPFSLVHSTLKGKIKSNKYPTI